MLRYLRQDFFNFMSELKLSGIFNAKVVVDQHIIENCGWFPAPHKFPRCVFQRLNRIALCLRRPIAYLPKSDCCFLDDIIGTYGAIEGFEDRLDYSPRENLVVVEPLDRCWNPLTEHRYIRGVGLKVWGYC